MSSPSPQNWFDRLAVVYLALAVLLTIAVRLVDGFNPAGIVRALSSLVALVCALLVLAAVWFELTRKQRHWRESVSACARKAASHRAFRSASAFWAAFGLQAYAIGSLLAVFRHHHGPGVGLIEAVLIGPLTIIAVLARSSPVHGSAALFLVLYLSWAVGVGVLMVKNKDAVKRHASMAGMKAALHAGKGSEWAPDEAPKNAHFAQIIGEVDDVHLPSPDNLIPIGYAELAPQWGARKNKELLGMPDEGSALLLGSPGSSKSLILQAVLLSQRAPAIGEDLLPTKIVALSTKTDLASATVGWIRSQGGAVGLWDLSGKVDDDRCGELLRWSPLVSVTDWDSAKKIGKRLVEAGSKSEGHGRENDFFGQAAQSVISPSLLAAKLAGKDYQTALTWSSHWSDKELLDPDDILSVHGEEDALHSWQRIRRLLLEKHEDKDTGKTTWSEPRGGVGSGEATGMSIDQTLQGLLLDVNTKAANKATDNPNLDPRDWIRRKDTAPSVLYLVGNEFEQGMTRSLLAPFLHNLLVEAYEFAGEHPGGALPYRLIILADELAQLAPIEGLEKFFAGARSRGIQILVAFQSAAQIEDLYGKPAMRTLFDSSAVLVILSGLRDRDLYSTLSEIAGHEQVRVTSEHEGRDKSTTTATQMRSLIDGHVLRTLARPNPARRKCGEGLYLAGESVVRITVPIWTFDGRWCERGTPPPKFHMLHTEFLEERRRHRARPHRRIAAWIRRLSSPEWAAESEAPEVPVPRPVNVSVPAPSAVAFAVGPTSVGVWCPEPSSALAEPKAAPGSGRRPLAHVRTPLHELRGTDSDIAPRPVAAMGSRPTRTGGISTLIVGWHPDPVEPELMRYFDGRQWTTRTRTMRSGEPRAANPGEPMPTPALPSVTEPPRTRLRHRVPQTSAKRAQFRTDLIQLIELRRNTFDAVNTARVPKEMAAIYQEQVEQFVVPEPDLPREWGITWLDGSPLARAPGGPWQRVFAWPTEIAT